MNDNELIFKPIHAPSHELKETEIKILLVKVINKKGL
jgi:hypothetical protein